MGWGKGGKGVGGGKGKGKGKGQGKGKGKGKAGSGTKWVPKPDANAPRQLGDMTVPPLCLGIMSMRAGNIYSYDAAKDEEGAFKTVEKALELGYNFLDTADVYGPNTSEEFVGECVEKFGRDKFIIATKFSLCHPTWGGPCGQPDYVKECLEGSLKRMKTDYVDLYQMHRMDPKTPIEETMGALKELKEAGKIKHIGLSECPANLLRRASKVCKVDVLQVEWSLIARDVEEDLVSTCLRMNIGILAYSPLARGLLSGAITKESIPQDWRATECPYLEGDNLDANLKLVDAFKALAEERKCTPSQLALAWVLSRNRHVVPIFGTKRVERLEENLKAAQLAADLGPDDWRACARAVPWRAVAGRERYKTGIPYKNEALKDPVKLKQPKFSEVSGIVPDSAGLNLRVKVTKAAGEADAKGVAQAQVADATGAVTLLCTGAAEAELCGEVGKTLRLQNGRVRMAGGYIRIEATKWGKLAVSEEELEGEANTETDVSAVEYELVQA